MQAAVKLAALGYSVEGFAEKDGGVDVLMKDQPSIHADMVVMAIGVTPESSLAKNAGLALGMKGSILVNDRMETSIPDIYAVGDAVQVKHYGAGEYGQMRRLREVRKGVPHRCHRDSGGVSMRRHWYDDLWFVLMFVPFVYRNARSSYQTAGIGFII